MPQEEDEVLEQPRTLVDVLKATLAKKDAGFNLAEKSGAGQVACLRRVACMLGPIQQLVRFTRLEEGLLSLAWVEHGQDLKLSPCNQNQHDVAMSRLVLNLCKTKLRAAAWQSSQEKLCRMVTSKNKAASRPRHAEGGEVRSTLRPLSAHGTIYDMFISIVFYIFLSCSAVETQPAVEEKECWQVLAIKGDACYPDAPKIVVAAIVTAFRGSMVKRSDGTTAVRAGRPAMGPLPAASARMLHVCKMLPIDGGQGPHWFSTSCASRPLVLDPANMVLGQLSVKREVGHQHPGVGLPRDLVHASQSPQQNHSIRLRPGGFCRLFAHECCP